MPSAHFLEAQARNRTEAEARKNPFLTLGLYLIIVKPQSGERYTREAEWPQLTNKGAALRLLQETDGAERVIYLPADGERSDVSEDFARDWLNALIDDGWVMDRDRIPDFIGKHMTDDEIEARYEEDVG